MLKRIRLTVIAFLILALSLISAGCASSTSDQGACTAPAPTVETQPVRAAPEETFQIIGENFASRYTCPDSGSEDGKSSQGFPEREISLEFVQHGRVWDLGTTNSDGNLSFEMDLEVPKDAKPGKAAVRATSRNYGPTKTRFVVLG